MLYIQNPKEILQAIDTLATYPILWVDTEIAHWDTANPKLSLIQVLSDAKDCSGEKAYLLDVFNQPQLIREFINKIMMNPLIEKVFHNAVFDLKYLGEKQALNVTCTYNISKKISLDVLGTPNRKLKTLASYLCGFKDVDIEEQSSDWGQRPLTAKQLAYASMDTVYLAHVHHRLLAIINGEEINNSVFFYVTQVRLAFECPRLFYLNYHLGGKSLFVPSDLVKGVGSAVHFLIAKFLKFAKQDSSLHEVFLPQVLDVEAIAFQLQDLFYRRIFYPYLQEAMASQSADVIQLNHIWQGITQLVPIWAKLLIKNRPYCSHTDLFQKTFVEEELSLEKEFILPDQSKAKITGKFDSLIFDCESNRFCVVEYKTYAPSDPSAQLAQVALYSDMLSSRETLPIDSAVYSLLPEFKAYHYSWEELRNTVYQVIPHKLQLMQQWLNWQPEHPNPPPATIHDYLCSLCPQQQKCQSYFLDGSNQSSDEVAKVINATPKIVDIPIQPKIIQPQSTPEIVDNLSSETTVEQKSSDGDAIAQKLIETLQAFKINAEYVGSIPALSFVRIKIKPNLGVKVGSILKLSQDLQVQLDLEGEPVITNSQGCVNIDLPRSDRRFSAVKDYISAEKSDNPSEIKIALGIDLNGKLIDADLSDSNTCHFLVGGTTGSGKSEFLKAVITSLIYRYTPEQVKLVLVDPKRVSFLDFQEMPYLLYPVIKDNAVAIEVLQELVSEMHRRYRLLEKNGCNSLKNYNLLLSKEKKPSIPFIVTVFDEYADLMVEKENKNFLETSIKSLGAMARAAGIHLIIATQRPDANVVTPLIRSNLPGRIALRTASEADSKIILGGNMTEAFKLLGKGDLFYQTHQGLERLQSLSTNGS